MAIYKNRVAETTGTAGTGTITGAGAIAQHQDLSAYSSGDPVTYTLLSGNGTDWEVGLGTVTISGGTRTMSRDAVEESSAAGAKISLTGTSKVFVTIPASRASLQTGQWGPVLSGVPTSASTGLTTWANQGSASVADRATGVTLTTADATTDSWRIRYKAVASPPYSYKALVALSPNGGTNSQLGLGWYDGTRAHVLRVFQSSTGAPVLNLTRYSTLNTFNSNVDYVGPSGGTPHMVWLKIRDDGTTVYWQVSISGDDSDFITLYSIAKASGYLGSSGYSNVFFGIAANAAANSAKATLMSFSQGT